MPIVVVKVFFVPHSYRLSQFTKFQFPMKIVSRFFMLLLCLVLASSCAQDEPLAPENGGNTSTPELSTRTIHMTAGTASAVDVTRTTLEGVNVLWDEGDQFRVMDTNGLDWVMKADEDAKAHTSGGFTGSTNSDVKPTNTAMAVFPSDGLTSYTDGNLTITIPQTQTYVPGSFDHKANVMAGPVTPVTGETDTYSAEFYNMMGVLKLQLKGNQTVSSIALMDNDPQSNLWGTATLSAANFSNGITTTNISNGGHIIVLDCPNGVQLSQEESTPFYFVVPAGAFANGFTATVYTTDNKYKDISTTKNQTISKNSIKTMKAIEVVATETLGEVDIENVAVKAYMGQSGSPKFRTTTLGIISIGGSSLINSTTNQTKYEYLDKPIYDSIALSGKAPYSITFTDVTKGIDIYRNRNYPLTIPNTYPDNKYTKEFNNSSTYKFINMIPNHLYSYEIVNASGNVIKGKFKAIAQHSVREVIIADSWNYRDLGGWPSTLGGTIRYEWIYRGGSLNGTWNDEKNPKGSNLKQAETDNNDNYTFSKIGSLQIQDLGIKAELDLRAMPDGKNDSKIRIHNRAIGEGKTNIADWTYKQISTSGSLTNPLTDDAIVRDVEWIIDQVLAGKPVAFHCKSGADRTGALAMIIEALLGVTEANIARDYELTTYSSENNIVDNGETGLRKRMTTDAKDEFFWKGFTYNSTVKINKKNYTLANWQEKAYYYLNQQFTNGTKIPALKLDAFIKFMLEIDSYTHPSWAE